MFTLFYLSLMLAFACRMGVNEWCEGKRFPWFVWPTLASLLVVEYFLMGLIQ